MYLCTCAGILPLPDALIYLMAHLVRNFTRDYLNGHPRSLRRTNFALYGLVSMRGRIVATNALIGCDRQCPPTQFICKNLFCSGIDIEPNGLEMSLVKPCDIGLDNLREFATRAKGIAP
jgi:hypothetical protein